MKRNLCEISVGLGLIDHCGNSWFCKTKVASASESAAKTEAQSVAVRMRYGELWGVITVGLWVSREKDCFGFLERDPGGCPPAHLPLTAKVPGDGTRSSSGNRTGGQYAI